MILEDYLGFTAAEIDGRRITASIPGVPSFPFKRMGHTHTFSQNERWIEVFYHDDCIDVITRLTDEFTNAVAEGFYALMLRYFQAATEKEEMDARAASSGWSAGTV